ncbi:MAG TPA: hypothetical protein VFP10_11270 [Candidatus Eisenbacteria bacterium]|nr:hypothetical protein [Candidatus Eisenbacteria bacterium]
MRGWILAFCVVASACHAVPSLFAQETSPAEKAETEGRWTDAVKLRREAYAASATRRDAALYLQALAAAGKDAEVIAEAAKATSKFPGWSLPAILSARASTRLGKTLEGAERLAGVRAPAAQAERGRLLLRLGRRADAARVFADVKASGGSRGPEALWARGHAAWASGEFESASRSFEQAYRESLDYLDARLDLARLFQQKYQELLAQEEL